MNKIVIKASAGTGKTYRISLEYIKMLLSNVKVDEILVTTFTKRATYEIKERIFSLLEDLSNGKIVENLNISIEKVEEIYKNLINSKNKMKIYTIDSFISSIFNRFIVPYFHLYGYELIDDRKNEKFYEDILKVLIQNDNKFKKISNFLNINFEKDITNYIEWIREFLYNRWIFLITVPNSYDVKNIEVGEVEKAFDETILLIEELIKEKDGSLLDYIKDDFVIILNNREELLKNYSLLLEQQIWNGNKLRANKANREMFNDLLKSYDIFRKRLAEYMYYKEIIPLEKELLKIGNIIFKEYDILKEKSKKFTYNDLLIYTYKFICDTKADPYQDIKVMFIDEFQDTSILQWLILKHFVNKSLKFIAVGDEKQAIYGWRGSEKGLFKNLANNIKAAEESLTISYRSEKEIIDFNNKFFNHLGLLDYDIKALPKNDKGYVEVKVIERDNFAQEIIDLIKSKKLNLKNSCILCRNNRDLDKVSDYLNDLDIPFIKESSLNLLSNRAIKPLYWLLKFILTSNFICLIKFLRGELIEITSRDLKEIIDERAKIELFFREDFKLNINSKVLKVLEEIRKLKFTNFRDLIKSSLEVFSFKRIFPSLIDIKNMKFFLEKSKYFNSLNDFINFLEDNQKNDKLKQLGVEDTDALKLMTIHKSKGLEFENVILYWNFSRTETNEDKLSFNLNFEENFEKVKDYCFTTKNLEISLEYLGFNYLKGKRDRKWEEEKNNLYVGLTRAKKNLFFLISFDRSIESLEKVDIKSYNDKIYNEFKDAIINSLNIKNVGEIYNNAYSIGRFVSEDIGEIKESLTHIDFSFLKSYF